MKCAGCGHESAAGARYCVHCGAEQATPTPIAVAAAAMATRPRSPVPHAANAPQADLAQDGGGSGSRATRHQPDAWGVDTLAPAFPAGSDTYDLPISNQSAASSRTPPPTAPAAIPVYAAHPRRLGVAALLIAACVIVALLAFVAWKVGQGDPTAPVVAPGERDGSVMSSFPPDATPQRTQRADTPAPASEPEKSPSPTAPPEPGVTAQPVEIKPLPAKPAHRATPATPAPKSTSPASVAIAPEPAPVPARPQAVAAAPKAPAVDRWAQMNDDLSRCTREDFISRVICDQRVRFRYCNGYWGKTPQCPGNPAPERGQ